MTNRSSADECRPFRMLVIRTGNQARSQMAHGWLVHLGGERVAVDSAGTEPRGVHPLAVRVMAEAGIDISAHTSDHVDRYVGENYGLLMGRRGQWRDQTPPRRPGRRQPADGV